MKIKKPVLACALVAGLAGMSGVAASDQARPESQAQIGYYIAKNSAQVYDLTEDQEDVVQAGAQAGGAVIGAAAGAYLGMKIGIAFGVFGAVIGGVAGAI